MLLLFDIDGTLCRSFLREGRSRSDFDLIEPLPGRVQQIARLRHTWGPALRMALVTNQGGVAMGYQTLEQVARKIKGVQLALGMPGGLIRIRPSCLIDYRGRECMRTPAAQVVAAYLSIGHPEAKIEQHKTSAGDSWRKPGNGMLYAAMADHGVTSRETCFVGDMASDELAAHRAGVTYHDAQDFFAANA
jgi:histidinol phosphatase-like enzyme